MPQAIPSETLEIDRKARAIRQCEKVEMRPPGERVQDFDDVVIPLGVECIQLQASRCIHCPDPAACVVACPLHNDIPSAMWLIEQGQFLKQLHYIARPAHCRKSAVVCALTSKFVKALVY